MSNINRNLFLSLIIPATTKKVQTIIEKVIVYILVLMVIFAVLAPFLWMLISSISPQTELSAKPPHWIPKTPTLARYRAIFLHTDEVQSLPVGVEKFLQGLVNSLIISSATTVVCVVAGSMAAYASARLAIPGKRHFLFGILGSQMLPVIVIIIPLNIMMQRYNLIDRWYGLVFLYSGFLLPTVIWIMHSYFLSLPRELEEAALIDGCTRLGSLVRIIMPLSGPGVVAVSAFAFLSSWNEFFMALIFTASKAKTITVVVTEFSSQFGTDYGLMATGGVIGSIPPILLALLLQRYIIAGLTAGAIKG